MCSTQVQLFHRFFPPSEQSSAAAARLATIFFAPLHEVMRPLVIKCADLLLLCDLCEVRALTVPPRSLIGSR